MPKQLVPNTAQFVIRQRYTPIVSPDVDFQNTVYVRNTVNPWTALKLGVTAGLIENAWYNEIQANQSEHIDYIEILAEDLGADPGNQHAEPMAGAGGTAGNVMPASVCALVQLKGPSSNHPRSGRLYYSGLGEAHVQGNFVTPAFVALLENDFQNFFGTALGAGDAFVMVSRYDEVYRSPDNPKGLRPVGLTNTIEPSAIRVRALIGSQRDRRT